MQSIMGELMASRVMARGSAQRPPSHRVDHFLQTFSDPQAREGGILAGVWERAHLRAVGVLMTEDRRLTTDQGCNLQCSPVDPRQLGGNNGLEPAIRRRGSIFAL